MSLHLPSYSNIFFKKSDKCAYITGFNRSVWIIFPKLYACRDTACCAWCKKVSYILNIVQWYCTINELFVTYD